MTLFDDGDRKDNAIISSVSLYDVLAMVQQGAAGITQQELNKVLGAYPASTRQSYSKLISYTKGSHADTDVEFASKMYLQEGFSVKPNFEDIVARDFESEVDSVNFKQAGEAAQLINTWVSNSTHDKITDLVSPDAITPDTVLVLLNAVFFSGVWLHPFDEDDTKDDSFSTITGDSASVPMMHLHNIFGAAHSAQVGASYVHLPFRGNDYHMVVVVPDEVDGLGSVMDNLQHYGLRSVLTYPELRTVDLKMPKFKFGSNWQLVPALQELGLQRVFTNQANLQGIASGPLYVSDVLQKAEIDVAEKGATAAAATGIFIHSRSIRRIRNKEVLEIVADRPFLFLLMDHKNKVPLFSGWVGAPSEN